MKKFVFALALAALAWLVFFYRDSLITKTSLSVTSERRGVVFHDRIRASSGYHLIDHYLHENRCSFADGPELAKFSFPGSFCTFLENGSSFSYLQDHLVFWQANGLPNWKTYSPIHHDISVDEMKQTIFVLIWRALQENGVKGITDPDVIKGYDFQGEQIFSWNILDHKKAFEAMIQRPLERKLKESDPPFYEYTHLNSVQELPENPVATHIPAFRAGNLLVNDYRLGVIFVIERQSKKIGWHYFPPEGIFAHSVRLNGEGQIVFLNNHKGNGGQNGPRHSSIDFLDPVKKEITHSITTDPKESFFTDYWGSLQLLPGGRYLVTNSISGSAFEIDHSGRILWEWINPENEANKVKPIYRVQLFPKERIDKALRDWKPL